MTKKVTELPAATTPLSGADVLLVVQGGVSKQSPVSGLPSSGGALTNLTEAKNVAAPNATVPVVSLSVTITETNGDVAIVPKGTGAILSAVPDSTSTGGNKRGSGSVDLQLSRTNAAHVASGGFSALVAGRRNTASGGSSCVVSGLDSTASGTNAAVIAGNTNSATQTDSAVVGGSGNAATGNSSAVLGGISNQADGGYSSIVGGQFATARGVHAAEARASGRFTATGDAQRQRHIQRVSTANATVTALTSDSAAASSTNLAVLPNQGTYGFSAVIVARNNTDQARFSVSGLINRGANAASTALVGSATVSQTNATAGAAAWSVSAVADTTLGAIRLDVTGAAATNIKWVADLETIEVVG